MVDILEQVAVWAYFQNGKIKPSILVWRNRQIKINKINLIHTSKSGALIFYHFSLSSGNNFYRILFDPLRLQWFLEAVEEGD